jgi:hypothetical protein
MLVSAGSEESEGESASSCRYPMKPSIDSLALAGTGSGSGAVADGGESERSWAPPQLDIRSAAASATHMAETADLRLVFMLLLLVLRGT